jgi:hypothetical protein
MRRAPADLSYAGRVESGKLLVDRARLWAEVEGLPDGDYVVTIERVRPKRSVDQNAYMWGVVVHLLSEHTGYEPEEMHAWLKAQFLPKALAVVTRHGEVIEHAVGGSTTTLTTVEFIDYIERIQRWAAIELGVVIPDPDPALRTRARTTEVRRPTPRRVAAARQRAAFARA